MIWTTQSGRTKLTVVLRHCALVAGAVLVAATAGLGAEILIKNSQASGLEHQNDLVMKEIGHTGDEIDKANRLAASNAPNDLGAVAKLQSILEELAASKGCSVVEFRASSEMAPYLTRFAKTTSVQGWGQVQVQLSISGRAKDVAAALTGLIDKDLPLEFDSLDIARDKVDDVGDATVLGHATLRVLIRTAKEAA